MEYAIYTFGGGEILWQVLNSIALIFKSESTYFTPVAKISLSIGGLWAVMRAVFGGNIGVFAKDWFVPSFFMVTLFLAPKTSVLVIDKVDPSHVISKIDHVPAGLALVASTASTISMNITELLEEKLTPLDADIGRYSRTGPMFAAHLLAASRDIRVADPRIRKNLKDFMSQCYLWPFILTDIAPGRAEAEKASDLLSFIATHAHPSLGIYWRQPSGKSTFTYCKNCVASVRAALNQEAPNGFAQLSREVFAGRGGKLDPARTTHKLKSYLSQGWNFISTGGEAAHKLVGQQMLINAYREGLDDKREAHQMPRLHPRLVSYSATRGSAQQNAGFLVSGLMAAKYLPSLQSVFFAILLVAFILILPFSLLPGGVTFVTTWIKMVVWVQSWPMFFAILNCIGLMWLSKAAGAELLSGDGGLNLLTQNGLADAAWDSYCIVQNLFLSVPILSWALISKGGMALVSLAERMTPALGRALGPSLVDNTPTFDVQAFHNRTIGSYQLAQQQLSPAMYAGSLVDDGRSLMRTSVTGEQTFSQHMSHLKSSVAANSNMEASFTEQGSQDYQAAMAINDQLSQTRTETLGQTTDIIEGWSKGTVVGKNFSEAENRGTQDTAQKTLHAIDQINQQDTLNEGAKWNHTGGFGAKVSGLILQKAGLGADLNVGTGGALEAGRQETMNKLKQYGVSENDMETLARGVQASVNNSATFNDDHSFRSSEALRASLDRHESLSNQYNATMNRSERFTQMASSMQRISGSLSTNLNDDVLDYVAAKKFSGNKSKAANWSYENPSAFSAEAQSYLSGWESRAKQMVADSKVPINSQTITSAYGNYKSSVVSRPSSLSAQTEVSRKTVESGMTDQWKQSVENRSGTQSFEAEMKLAQQNQSNKEKFYEEQKELKEKYAREAEKTLIRRALPNIVNGGDK